MVNKKPTPASIGRKRPRTAKHGEAASGANSASHPTSHDLNRAGHLEEEEDPEEARIRELIFGKGESSLLALFGAESQQSEDAEPQANGHELGFFEDHAGEAGAQEGSGVGLVPLEQKGRAAWVDDDDEHLKVDISAKNRLKKLRHNRGEGDLTGPEFEQRLRDRFASSNVTVEWVKAAEDAKRREKKRAAKQAKAALQVGSNDSAISDEDTDAFADEEGEELLRDSTALKGGKGGVLQPGYLDIVRCKDANQHDPAKAVVRAVHFHPTGELLLAGGLDKTLRLFQVDGVENPKMHSLFFEDLPISQAMFTGTDQAVVTGKRAFFYSYDVATGRVQKIPRIFSGGRAEKHMDTFAASPDGQWLAFAASGGYVLLVSNRTKQWAADFKLNCRPVAVEFTPDSAYVLASGADGDVFKFDVRSRRCMLRFFNEGGTCTTSISVSPSASHRLTAVGSDSGVVNVYGADAFESGKRVLRPAPLKAVMSLTTPVTMTKFSPDGQMLAIASSEKRDALKVIHSASCTPFTNWPTERTPVRYPFALDFSPGGGYLAVGNDRGCVLLYRVRHYPQA